MIAYVPGTDSLRHDPKTGLKPRRKFFQLLSVIFTRSRSFPRPVSYACPIERERGRVIDGLAHSASTPCRDASQGGAAEPRVASD